MGNALRIPVDKLNQSSYIGACARNEERSSLVTEINLHIDDQQQYLDRILIGRGQPGWFGLGCDG